MVKSTKTIHVVLGSELDGLLDEAEHAPVILERNGERFRLAKEPVDDIWAGYDPGKILAALDVSAF